LAVGASCGLRLEATTRLRGQWVQEVAHVAAQSGDINRVQRTSNAVIRRGDDSGYVAECLELPVVTQGATLDEVATNLNEAVSLHLSGEEADLSGVGPESPTAPGPSPVDALDGACECRL
jgi:predicted RNase H-like HicB family nuclease